MTPFHESSESSQGRAYWDRTWNRFLRHQAMIAPSGKLIQLMLPRLPRGCRVVDLGCGEGRNTLYLARIGYQAIGIDISAQGIRALENNLFEEEVKAGAVIGDAAAIPLGDASVTGVLAHNLMDHLDRDTMERAVAECWRILRPDGVMLLTVDSAATLTGQPQSQYVTRDDGSVVFVRGQRRGMLFRPCQPGELEALAEAGWQVLRDETSPRGSRILLVAKPAKLSGAAS